MHYVLGVDNNKNNNRIYIAPYGVTSGHRKILESQKLLVEFLLKIATKKSKEDC